MNTYAGGGVLLLVVSWRSIMLDKMVELAEFGFVMTDIPWARCIY